MPDRWNRRTVLKKLLMAGGALMFPAQRSGASPGTATRSAELEIQIASVSPLTLRLSLLSVKDGQATAIPFNGSLAHASWGAPVATLGGDWHAQVVNAGEMRVLVDPDPLAFTITNIEGKRIQRLTIDRETGVVGFETGGSPLFGLGEGGPQFDRRGSVDRMASGQGVYKLRTHGGRVPIPWIIGSAGWAIFFHQPFGTFNLTGAQSRFEPGHDASSLPLDLFFVASPHPAAIMGEYARLTGHAEFPPCGVSGTSSRIALSAAGKKFWKKPTLFVKRSCHAMPSSTWVRVFVRQAGTPRTAPLCGTHEYFPIPKKC